MLPKNIYPLVSLFAVCLVAGCAKPDLKAEAQKALTASYKASDDAITNKNIDGALAMYSPDVVLVDPSGKTVGNGLEANRQKMQAALAIPNSTIKRTTTIQDITLNNSQGTEVIATINQTADASAMGQNITVKAVLKDFWVKGSDGWHIKRERVVSLSR